MADIAHVRDGFVGYANAEIIPHLPVTQQFVAGMVVGILRSKAETAYAMLRQNQAIRMLGLIDDQGDIDVSTLYNAAKEQIQRSGKLSLDVPMIGEMTFTESDIDALYQHIANGG